MAVAKLYVIAEVACCQYKPVLLSLTTPPEAVYRPAGAAAGTGVVASSKLTAAPPARRMADPFMVTLLGFQLLGDRSFEELSPACTCVASPSAAQPRQNVESSGCPVLSARSEH